MRRPTFMFTIPLTLLACDLLESEQSAPAPTAIQIPVPILAPASSASSTSAGTAQVAPETPTAPSAPAAPVGLFADKLPTGLPALDLAPVSVDTMKKSTELDTAAGKARDAKDYAKAIGLYTEALEADPGNRFARYDLARTFVLDSKPEAGLALLDQLFRAPDCYRCQGLLLRAAQEKDFASLAERPEFKERTQGVGQRLPTVEHAVKQVLAWLGDPKLSNLPPLVDSRTFIVLHQKSAGYRQFKGVEAFLDYAVTHEKENFPRGKKWGGKIGPPDGLSYKCPNECCEIDSYEPPRRRSILRQICFKTEGSVAVALYKLQVD